MESKTTDFLGLIKGPRQYRIPPFQRAYSWEKEQREALWLDILGQYDKLRDLWTAPDREERLRNIPGHYLGTIVLAGPSALGVPKSDVIDGQQRITTLLLLLCALRDVRARAESKQPGTSEERTQRAEAVRKRIGRRYLLNEDETGTDRLRVVPLAADRRAFRAVIDFDGSGQLSHESLGLDDIDSRKILQGYKFFSTELRRQQVVPDRSPQLTRFTHLFPLDLEILEEVVTRRLTLITIETANLDDVNAIFESLNATGRPLTQLDLLRNYIFMALHTRAEEALDKHWGVIQNNLHRPEEVESLIWADVVSRGTSILQKRTYRTVQAELRQLGGTPEVAEDYLASLARKSAYYSGLLHPDREPNQELRRAFERLQAAGGLTAYPIVLWLFEQRHLGHVNNAQIVEGVAWIESFLVRRFVAGLPPNNLTSMFGSMLARIHGDDLSSVEDRMLRLQLSMVSNPKEWPSNDVVTSGVQNEDFYHNQKASQRMLILSTIDHSLAPQTVLNYGDTDDSIEHILPQRKDDAEWRADLLELSEELSEVQDRWLHTLPNLTIVTPNENSQLSFKRFAGKRAIFADSQYRLTSELAGFRDDLTDGGRLWGSEVMRARGEVLAQRILSIWPRPAHNLDGKQAPDASVEADFDVDENEELLPFTSLAEEPGIE